MLRCSLTSRRQCQCKPNVELWELALKSYAEVQPDFAKTMSVQTECRTWKLVFESYAEVQPDFAKQRYNIVTSESKFFDPLISHLESFPHLRMSIQPFVYRHSDAFSTREKKLKLGYNFLSLADSQNVRSSNALPHPNVTSHTFLLLSH